MAAPAGSIIDQFEASGPNVVFMQYPDLARFRTIGSPGGETYASLADETAAAITRVQTMMSDVDTGWSEVIEVRVLTTSASDQATVVALIAADPRLSALPVSYQVLDRLPADRARIGLDVLVTSAKAVASMGH
ncbi:MAG: hypothetical protein WC068_06095 [Caulobacter sp.]